MAGAVQSRGRRIEVIILVLFFLFATSFAYKILTANKADPDMFWHLKTGQYIVQEREIPRQDVFSWYGQEHKLEWLPHEWLFDIGLYGVWRLADFQAIYVLASLFFGGTALLVYALTRLRTGRFLTSLIVATVAFLGVAPFTAPRPQVLTYFLLVACALVLERKHWYVALALMLVGVNLHGGMYPLYLVLFAYYAFPMNMKVMALAVLTVFLTPLGWHLLPYPFFAFDDQMKVFIEAKPTILADHWVLLGSFLAVLFLVDFRKIPKRDTIAALALALLALKGIRNMTFFFLLGLPLLAPHFRWLGATVPSSTEADEVGPEAETTSRVFDAGLILVLAAAVLILAIPSVTRPLNVDRGYPKEALEYVEKNDIVNVWNLWEDGGYMLYRGVPSFVDGRADPFSPYFDRNVTLATDYLKAYFLQTDIRPFLDKYGVNALLVRNDLALYQLLDQSRDFERVYSDRLYTVFRYEGQE